MIFIKNNGKYRYLPVQTFLSKNIVLLHYVGFHFFFFMMILEIKFVVEQSPIRTKEVFFDIFGNGTIN